MFFKKRYVAIIQARMGSSRLPGKVLLKINDKPVLQHLIERIKKSKQVTHVCIATSTHKQDDPIVELCKKLKINYFRGSEDDVLLRVTKAASYMKAAFVVDITGDCPLVDPELIDIFIKTLKKEKLNYIGNIIIRSFADGFDIQVYSKSLLDFVNYLVMDKNHRAHTGWNIIKYQKSIENLRDKHILAPVKYHKPEWGLTLDTREDFMLLYIILFSHFNRSGKKNKFTYEDVMEMLLENISLLDINNDIKRKTAEEG
jgi:spore coat polysaccharide biosynthesis protein SpsF